MNGLVKRYGGRTVVDEVSFEVPPGRVLALLGPNGAGKTTTVECIAGLRRADGGSVRVLGADPVAQRDSVMAVLGMMLQEGGVHRSSTPRELLRLFSALHDSPADTAKLVARLGIDDLLDARVRTLSGGERQRVSLALALIGQPRVAVLDEPTAGMDPVARRQVWELVAELAADGVAVLLTTHAMEEAERLADVVAVMGEGRLLALDTPSALTSADSPGLVLSTAAAFPADELASDLDAPVWREAPGRWKVAVAADRMTDVTAWFRDRDLPLTGIATSEHSLEDVYLRLIERGRAR